MFSQFSDDKIEETATAMGNTIEQHRSAIGRFKLLGGQRVSAKTRRGICLSEIMAILSVAKKRLEAKQVGSKKSNYYEILFVFNCRFGKVSSCPLLSFHFGCSQQMPCWKLFQLQPLHKKLSNNITASHLPSPITQQTL